ncbi:MAG: DNA double-strand break repair nuclease NurA [Deinococcaceae bacterium]
MQLDPWSESTRSPGVGLRPFAGDVITDLEMAEWVPCPSTSLPGCLKTLHLIDGSRRLDARVIVWSDEKPYYGGLGTCSVGHVSMDLCSRSAHIAQVVNHRYLVVGGAVSGTSVAIDPPRGGTGELVYTFYADPKSRNERETPIVLLQSLMLRQEQQSVDRLALRLDDVARGFFEFDTLVLQDGRVEMGSSGSLVLGYIKALETDYLGLSERAVLGRLQVGERTPIFYFQYGGDTKGRFSWYVRLLPESVLFTQGSGLVRLEMLAPDGFDTLPDVVKQIADFSPLLLGRLASSLYKDPRAPQNLIPTGALERELKRRMGDPQLISRRIRRWVMEQSQVRSV